MEPEKLKKVSPFSSSLKKIMEKNRKKELERRAHYEPMIVNWINVPLVRVKIPRPVSLPKKKDLVLERWWKGEITQLELLQEGIKKSKITNEVQEVANTMKYMVQELANIGDLPMKKITTSSKNSKLYTRLETQQKIDKSSFLDLKTRPKISFAITPRPGTLIMSKLRNGPAEVFTMEEEDEHEDVKMPTEKKEQEILVVDDDRVETNGKKYDEAEKFDGEGEGVAEEVEKKNGLKRKAEEELQGSPTKVTFLETKYAPCLKKCEELTAELMSSKYKAISWPFFAPCNINPLELITFDFETGDLHGDLDLRTVESNLETAVYKNPQEFASDVRLIFTNCYNCCEAGSEVHEMAQELEKVFEEKFKLLYVDEEETASSAANTDADGTARV